MKKQHKKILQDIFVYISLALFLLGVLLQPFSAAYEAKGNIQDVVEEEPVTEPVVAQERVTEEVVDEVREATDPAVAEPVETESELLDYDYFDAPLDLELQEYIFMVCDLYDNIVDPAVIIAMIEKESTYRADAIGDNGKSFGLMQIQRRWHEQRMLDLGVTDLLDPYQNVSVGIDYICELRLRGEDISWALMAYNGGAAYANRLAADGRVSDYARYVLDRSWELGWYRYVK